MSLLRSALWKSTPIQSFIIFDAEATGLVQSKFVEICFLGILRDDLLAGGSDCPRVANKLVLYMDAGKDLESHTIATTGLTKGKLSGQKPFNDETVDCMTSFIERLPKPVCLVSHNGNKFDFAILNTELRQLGKTLPQDLECADTFKACKELEPRGESVSLENLYKRYYGQSPPDAHRAEGDCLALLKILLKKPNAFVKWMDSHAVPLKNIPPRY